MLALLGLIGTWGGVLQTVTLLAGGAVERPVAVLVQAVTAILCAALLVTVGRGRGRAGPVGRAPTNASRRSL